MKHEKLLDVMYEVMAEKIVVPEKLSKISKQKYEEIEVDLKKVIANEEVVSKITENLDEFIGALSNEEKYKNKMSYKGGMEHYAKLKKEMQEIITSKTVQKNDNFLEEFYNCRVENLCKITEEEKEFIKKLQSQRIDISSYLKGYDEELIEKVNEIVQNRVNQFWEEMSFYCKKYYINGLKDKINFITECSNIK